MFDPKSSPMTSAARLVVRVVSAVMLILGLMMIGWLVVDIVVRTPW